MTKEDLVIDETYWKIEISTTGMACIYKCSCRGRMRDYPNVIEFYTADPRSPITSTYEGVDLVPDMVFKTFQEAKDKLIARLSKSIGEILGVGERVKIAWPDYNAPVNKGV